MLLYSNQQKDDLLHKGTVRLDRLFKWKSCNIGDVNPGAIVSAKKILRLGQV